jgi:hypothetical protein
MYPKILTIVRRIKIRQTMIAKSIGGSSNLLEIKLKAIKKNTVK